MRCLVRKILVCGITVIFLLLSRSVVLADESISFEETLAKPQSERLWSVMLFGGQLSTNNLDEIFSGDTNYTDTSFVGLALSREFWRNDWIALELEGGLGQQFGGDRGDRATQVWGAGYLRYHRFPWNDYVRTTIAASLGLNYSSRKTTFENNETDDGDTKKLQNYFSPEITFGLPQYPDADLVFRIHHRSSVFGLFGCKGCGSNVPTVGFRYRF